MKLWMSSRCQPSPGCDSNQALLARSRRTTARVSQSQRRRAGIMNASDRRMGGCAFDFREGFAAPLADGWITRVLADVRGIVPAALTLFAVGFADQNVEIRGFATGS